MEIILFGRFRWNLWTMDALTVHPGVPGDIVSGKPIDNEDEDGEVGHQHIGTK